MNKERLGTWSVVAQIVAALGVIASVIYLGIQVAGSTNALRTQTRHNLLSMANASMERLLGDEQLADIVARGQSDSESLSDAEWYRFGIYELLAFNAWEYGYYLNRSRSTPPELWEGLDAYYRNLVNTEPGLRRFRAEYNHAFAEPFHAYVDSQFASSTHKQAMVHAMGAEVMPFDLTRTQHIFEMTEHDGIQDVIVRDSADEDQVPLIQRHLAHEAMRFAAGEFSDPSALHGADMPGLEALTAGVSRVKIEYRSLPGGGWITFATSDPQLVTAIHRWFGAQLSDHGADATYR